MGVMLVTIQIPGFPLKLYAILVNFFYFCSSCSGNADPNLRARLHVILLARNSKLIVS